MLHKEIELVKQIVTCHNNVTVKLWCDFLL